MNTQINLRLSESLLLSAKKYANKQGFSNIQEFIKETIREKIFKQELTKEEILLIKKFIEATDRNKLWLKEEDLFKELKKN